MGLLISKSEAVCFKVLALQQIPHKRFYKYFGRIINPHLRNTINDKHLPTSQQHGGVETNTLSERREEEVRGGGAPGGARVVWTSSILSETPYPRWSVP